MPCDELELEETTTDFAKTKFKTGLFFVPDIDTEGLSPVVTVPIEMLSKLFPLLELLPLLSLQLTDKTPLVIDTVVTF
jgi:hypothetical protein